MANVFLKFTRFIHCREIAYRSARFDFMAGGIILPPEEDERAFFRCRLIKSKIQKMRSKRSAFFFEYPRRKMVVVMKKEAKENQVTRVLAKIESLGLKAHLSRGKIRTIVGVVGDNSKTDSSVFECLEGVERVVPLLGPFKLASRDFKKEDTVFSIDGSQIGNKKIVVMAGPVQLKTEIR